MPTTPDKGWSHSDSRNWSRLAVGRHRRSGPRTIPDSSPERVEDVSFHLHIGADVATGRRNARVSEVIADDCDIDTGLQERYSAKVPAGRVG